MDSNIVGFHTKSVYGTYMLFCEKVAVSYQGVGDIGCNDVFQTCACYVCMHVKYVGRKLLAFGFSPFILKQIILQIFRVIGLSPVNKGC